jgi:hypothetical protein
VRAAERRAADLVTRFYALAPREWGRMRYEVRTLDQLDATDITDRALAQVLCYGVRREVGDRVVAEHDLYRICLQDHRIPGACGAGAEVPFRALLLFVLTHELVHVVRFGLALRPLDLPWSLRAGEEASVDRTARLILRASDEPGLGRILERFASPDA